MFGTESTNEVQQQEDNELQWIRIDYIDYPLHVSLIDKLLYRGRVKDEDLVMFGPPRRDRKKIFAGCSADIR